MLQVLDTSVLSWEGKCELSLTRNIAFIYIFIYLLIYFGQKLLICHKAPNSTVMFKHCNALFVVALLYVLILVLFFKGLTVIEPVKCGFSKENNMFQ